MDVLQPVLFGFTVRDLWDLVQPVCLVGWVVLLALPKWKYTFDFVLVPSLIISVIYACVLLPIAIADDPIDFSAMDAVFALFSVPEFFFCGWIHYLAFDLLIARGLALDALNTCKVSLLVYYCVVAPCLLMTLFFGPVGFLLYMTLRAIVFKPGNDKKKQN